MPVLASVLAALIPILIYLYLIWRYDRFDPEPVSLYLKNFIWGAVGAILLSIVGNFFMSSFFSIFISDKHLLAHAETVIIAPVVEELTKGVFLLITVANRKFDNMTDGIVYGGAIGLGFGMTENFLYFIMFGNTFSEWIFLVIVRTLFTAVMHCVSTATFGAFLGYAKFRPVWIKILFPPLGLFLAMFIHFAWNYSVSFENTSIHGFLFLIGSIIIFLFTFKISVLNEKKLIYNELKEESSNGLIPEKHLTILNSTIRERKGWIDESIRKPYIKATTTLAFRKMQLKNSSGFNRLFYENEVNFHRKFLEGLLKEKDNEEFNLYLPGSDQPDL